MEIVVDHLKRQVRSPIGVRRLRVSVTAFRGGECSPVRQEEGAVDKVTYLVCSDRITGPVVLVSSETVICSDIVVYALCSGVRIVDICSRMNTIATCAAAFGPLFRVSQPTTSTRRIVDTLDVLVESERFA